MSEVKAKKSQAEFIREFIALAAKMEAQGRPRLRTLDRLTEIKPGERIIYYTGEMNRDIRICAQTADRRVGQSLTHGRLLSDIKTLAGRLAKAGKVKLSESIVTRFAIIDHKGNKTPVAVTQYVAEGV